jgi:polyhydroxyalkanoate synthesis repressor PhaR
MWASKGGEIMPRLIKRYANRRLYDVQAKKTITLEGLADLIKKDQDVMVMDNRTKQDITLPTLLQVLSLEAREWKESLPSPNVARELIVKGGETMVDLVKKAMLAGIGAFAVTKEKVEELVDDLIKKGEMSKDERAKFVRELVDKAEARSQEAKKWVDQRVKVSMSKLKMAKAEDLEALGKQMTDLTKAISRLEKKLKAQEGKSK